MNSADDTRLAQAPTSITDEEKLRHKLELLIARNIHAAGHRIETIAAALRLTADEVQRLLDERTVK